MKPIFTALLLVSLLFGGMPFPKMARTVQAQTARTRVVDRVTDAAGAPRRGVITFILLTKTASGPSGLVAVKPSISATLDTAGRFVVDVYPSHSLSPVAYYNVLFKDSAGNQENFGVYDVPISAQAVTLGSCKVTDANLAGQYLIPSVADLNSLVATLSTATLNKLNSVSRADGRIQKYDATTGNFVDSVINQSGGAVTVSGPVSATAVTGTSFSGIRDVDVPTTLTSKTLVTPTISGLANTGSITSTGTVAAVNLSGSCAGCTNFPTTSVGPTGLSSTGAITNNADSDGNGSGIIDDSINGVTKRRMNNDGTTDLIGGIAHSTKAGLPAAGNAGRIYRVTDDVRGLWMDTGTQWSALSGETVNVKEFGAKGDGATDDTTAIQDAIDAAGEGGVVLLPPGTYKVTDTIVINHASLVGLPGKTFITPSAAVSVAIDFYNDYPVSDEASPTFTNVLYGLVIDGVNTTNATGVRLGNNTVSLQLHLDHCEVRRFGGATGRGLHFVNTVQSVISNCRIERNGTNVYLLGSNSDFPTTTSFRDCYIWLSSVGPGVDIVGGYMTRFFGGVIESNRQEAIRITPAASHVALRTAVYGTWFENNWHLEDEPERFSKFSITVDGRAASSTAEIAMHDCYFNEVVKAVYMNTVVESIIDNCKTAVTAGQFEVRNSISQVDFRGYNPSVLSVLLNDVDGAIQLGSFGLRKDVEGGWTSWTPTIITNGGATMSATTITTARYKRLGNSKTIFIELNFTTTISAGDTGFIVSMPSGLFHRNVNTYTPALLFSGGAVVPGGYATSGGGVGSLTIVGGAVASGAGAGARFTGVFEIQ